MVARRIRSKNNKQLRATRSLNRKLRRLMKREEILELFPEATDEQIDKILNASHAEANTVKKTLKENEATLQTLKEQLQTANIDLSKYKALSEELNEKVKDSMSAEELLAQREKEAEVREREYMLKINALSAREIFQNAGLSVDEYENLVNDVVSEDAEKTAQLANKIAELAVNTRNNVAKQTQDQLLKGNPKPQGTGTNSGVSSKEEFLKLSTSEQMDIMEANPDVLSQLN